MPELKLLMSPASPFARKVRAMLLETGLAETVEQVAVSGTALASSPELVAANPLGKLPALLRGDGPVITNSRVITRYLDDLAGTGLYPAGRIWEVLTVEALADGMMEAGIAMVYESRLRPEEMRFAPWVEAQWQKIDRTLGALEDRWMSHLAGPFDASHTALACALGYLDFRMADRNWREGRPMLAAWEGKIAQRPSILATRPA